jgi:hypothetical protein
LCVEFTCVPQKQSNPKSFNLTFISKFFKTLNPVNFLSCI